MTSRRLPGKVLKEAAGRPLLAYLLERLARCEAAPPVVVATSDADSDAPIQAFCRDRGVRCHRGPLDDVAGRFLQVIDAYRFEAVVRVSADSPLLDPRLIDRAVNLFGAGDADLVTNVFPRSFPKGQSVEVVGAVPLRRAYSRMRMPEEREHVTAHFYGNPEHFRIVNFRAERDYSGVRLCVDTPDDFSVVEAIIGKMQGPHWQYGLDAVLRLEREVTGRRP